MIIFLVTSCSEVEPSASRATAIPAVVDTTSQDVAVPEGDEAIFALAYQTYLRPSLARHCTPCHEQGLYPFVAQDELASLDHIAVQLGKDADSSRLLQKISTEEHPPSADRNHVTEAVIPDVRESLTSFFDFLARSGYQKQRGSVETTPPLGLRAAFEEYLRPVLKENCARCHIHSDGAQPFASENLDTAFAAAQRHFGDSKENSRFFTKIKPGTHPIDLPEGVASAEIFPKVDSALSSIFEKISTDSLGQDGIYSPQLALASVSKRWPQISDRGLLIFEWEGATVAPKTKLKVQAGPFSNNLAITSNRIPAHAVSSEVRSYEVEQCGNDQPTITQRAHTKSDDFNAGVAKFSFFVRGIFRDPDAGNARILEKGRGVIIDLVRVLPNNFDYLANPSAPIPDSLYEESSSEIDAYGLTWREDQIRQIIAAVRNFRDSRANPSNAKHTHWIAYFARVDAAISSDPSRVLEFLELESEQVFGQVNLVTKAVDNSSLERLVHQDETLNFDTVAERYGIESVRPGKASFAFSVPEKIDGLGIDSDAASVPIKFFSKQNNSLWWRLKKAGGGYVSQRGTQTDCFEASGEGLWTALGPRFDLEFGVDYELEIYPKDQEIAADSFMAVVDTTTNELADPELDPTQLRHPIYGLESTNQQQQVGFLQWRMATDGRLKDLVFEVEVTSLDKYYRIESPQFRLRLGADHDQHVDVEGFDLKLNGVDAVSDNVFRVSAIRPVNRLAAFGSVLIDKDLGDAQDQLSIRFDRLQLVPTEDFFASLPDYRIPPPPGKVECKRLDVFTKNVLPLYTEQLVIQRRDYNSWRANTSYPTRVVGGRVEGARAPTMYRCRTCHGAGHPFFPMPADPQELCNEALARSDLNNPLLSYAIRGARGQFNHVPLYLAFDPFSGNQLRTYQQPSDDSIEHIYGPFLGRYDSYSLSEITAISQANPSLAPSVLDGLFSYLRRPATLILATDPVSGEPVMPLQTSRGIPLDASMSDPDQIKTVLRKDSEPTPILDAHNAALDKWVQLFVEWIEAEKAAK